jgi:hypothetical protein
VDFKVRYLPTIENRRVTLCIDMARYMQAPGIPSKREVHVLLVDRRGRILRRMTGSLDEVKGIELGPAIASHLGRAREAE